MDNVHAEVVDGVLTLTVDLHEPGTPSKSGKTLVIGSTRGNAAIPDGDGGEVIVGLNVYRGR